MNPYGNQDGQYQLPMNSHHHGYQNGHHGHQPGNQGYPQFPTDMHGYESSNYYGNPQPVENYPNQTTYYYGNQAMHEPYSYSNQPHGHDDSRRPRRGRGRGQRSRGRGQGYTSYTRNDPLVEDFSQLQERDHTRENESFTETAPSARNSSIRTPTSQASCRISNNTRHEAHHKRNKRSSVPAPATESARGRCEPAQPNGSSATFQAFGQGQQSDGRRGSGYKSSSNSGKYNSRRPRNSSSRGQGKYHHNFKQGSQEDIETQRGLLIEQLSSNTYECMVCCDVVKREASVWSCCNCYHVYHLYCIKKWAESSTATEDGSSGWRCPACQNITQQYPIQYRCFCGKLRNPDLNRNEIPHSCGEVCKKKRPNGCTHPCNILCHPGPCPPCLASIVKHCDCTKTEQTVKCAQASVLKCTKKCEKTLNCGRHECQLVCHAGPCDPCADLIKQVCFCSKESRTVLCGSSESFTSSYSCKLICDRALLCGNHNCDRHCHPGTCNSCSLLPSVITHCPCGKSRLLEVTVFTSSTSPRTSCMDPVPTCGAICGKKLLCGPKGLRSHVCERECHTGQCGPCLGMSEIMCRCGRFTKEITCQEATQYTEDNPFLCEKRCSKKRQCGKHKCGQLCCVDTEHTCDQVCGRKLTCSLHRCEEQCHRSNCPTCWHVSFDELPCYCGLEVLYPPIPCGTSPPECKQLCTRRHACGHTVRHNCHNDESCPQCTELTEKWCHGKHEMRRNIPCHQQDVSCGLPCNKQLDCGVHKCQSKCHKGECLAEDQKCSQPCPHPRADCGHPCGAPCHCTEPCPQVACKAEITLRCDCGNRSEKAMCLMGSDKNTDFMRMETSMLALTMSNAQDGQSIDISSLMKDANKKKQRKLECTSECSLKERNKRLALALEIKNPDLSNKLGNPSYTPFLKDYAKQNATFAASVEQELSKLVNTAQQSKQPKRSYAFKPMNNNQRRLVHELAEFYGCETQSYDEEPNKNIVATAHKGKCWHPSVTLTQCTRREIHPKAPTPIPHHSKEADIRATLDGSKKNTSTLGAWGKPSPKAPGQPTKSTPWAPTATAMVSKATDTLGGHGNTKLKSLSVLHKEDKGTGRCSPVIDYFDMSG